MNKLIIEDTTLRDGEQAPGIAFSKLDKIKIFNLLYLAGIRWFEVGIPVMGGDEVETLRELLKIKRDAVLVAWNRCNTNDIKQSIELGFEAVHIGAPTSSIHIDDSIERDKEWLLSNIVSAIKFAKEHDVYVSVSAEDVARTDREFLKLYAKTVEEAGADRLRLSDTIGILDFNEYGDIVKDIKSVSNIPLQCHAHNDMGLAVANTLSCINSGVDFFHITVNGVGERAGMPDVLQVVNLLKFKYNIDLKLDAKYLVEASDYINQITKTSCYPWTPIIGANAFKHESGIHVKGMLNNKKTFEGVPSNEYGKQSEFVLGKHSGKSSINYFLRQSGIVPTAEELTVCLDFIRQKSIENKGSVSKIELINYYNKLKGEEVKNVDRSV